MPKILLSCFSRREVQHIQYRLGTYYTFDAYRPEGKYRFDVGKKNEVDALCHLIHVKQKIQTSDLKFCRLYDLNSRAQWKDIEKVEDFLTEDHFPQSGILEMEFSIPDTPEAHAEKKKVVASELEQLDRAASMSKETARRVSLATLAFEFDGAGNYDSENGSDDGDGKKHTFDFAEAMSRTRKEYKLVSVLHADKSGMVRCADMADKPFNSRWDGGKTTIVCVLEDKEQKNQVHVTTPRGVNMYASVLIKWDSPFKTEIDISKTIQSEEFIKRETSAIQQARLHKFEAKRLSPIKQKTVPKRGGKGLRPVTPETFSGVKSVNFDLALRRSSGERMFKPWTGFVRSDPADFKIQRINLKAMSQHKDVGGVVSKRAAGSLGPASCVNYEIDLSMLVSMHTVPRYFTFQVKQGARMDIYVIPYELKK